MMVVGVSRARQGLGRALLLAEFSQADAHFGSRLRPDTASIFQAAIKMPTLPHTLANGARGNSEIHRCGFDLMEKGLSVVHGFKVV